MSNRFDWAEQLELRIGILEDQIAVSNYPPSKVNERRQARIKELRAQQNDRDVYRSELPVTNGHD